MFERFTYAARDAVKRARAESLSLQHPLVGTEHVLLALLLGDPDRMAPLLDTPAVTAETVRREIVRRVGVGPGPGPGTEADDAAALRAIGIDIELVRRTIEAKFGPGALQLPPPGPPRRRGLLRRRSRRPSSRGIFSDRAKKALELSLREAMHLKHRHIGPEHILLGILREGQGLGAQILYEAGVDLERVRARTVAALQHPAA